MSSIYVELKVANTSRSVSHIIKSGNTYFVYVKESFDVKIKNDLFSLLDKLNDELNKDGIEKMELRKIERELKRLEIGKRISVRI